MIEVSEFEEIPHGMETRIIKSGLYPTVTLRIDALKGILNPYMVSVSNVKSNTRRTSSCYTRGSGIDTYTTTTTADVHVTNGQIGIQDIGPKISFMNPKRSNHITTGMLFGVVGEGRSNVVDYGITLEGGKIGHGSVIEFKGVDEARRKLNKNKSEPIGTLNTINLYVNIGIDISPAFLVPFGIVIDKGESTSFFLLPQGLT